MVDRATALEQQASGSFDDLELKLDRAAIEPRPVPLTPEQLEALGIRPAPLVDESDLTDADRLDGLLAQHCVGEGKDGLIVDTRDACKGAADAEEVADARRAGEPRPPPALAMDARAARRRLGERAAARLAREPRAQRRLRRVDRRERRQVAGEVVLSARRRCARRRARARRRRSSGGARRPTTWTTTISACPQRLTVGVADDLLGQLEPGRQDALLRVEPRHDQPALRPEHGRRPRAAALRRRRRRHLAAGEPGRAVAPVHLVPRAAPRGSSASGACRTADGRRCLQDPSAALAGRVDRPRSDRARQPRSRSRGTCASSR